jgi:hypothetical protein
LGLGTEKTPARRPPGQPAVRRARQERRHQGSCGLSCKGRGEGRGRGCARVGGEGGRRVLLMMKEKKLHASNSPVREKKRKNVVRGGLQSRERKIWPIGKWDGDMVCVGCVLGWAGGILVFLSPSLFSAPEKKETAEVAKRSPPLLLLPPFCRHRPLSCCS